LNMLGLREVRSWLTRASIMKDNQNFHADLVHKRARLQDNTLVWVHTP